MMTLLCAWYHRQASKPHWPAGLVLGIVLGLLFVVVAPHQGTAAESHLRIMTYNVDGMSMNDRALLAVMRPYHPDLLLLQEVRSTAHVAVLGQALGLPYWRFASYSKERDGVALLSRWPLGPAQKLPWRHSPQGKLALAAQVDSPVGRFWACSAHLDNPLATTNPVTLWQKALFLWQEFFTTTQRVQEGALPHARGSREPDDPSPACPRENRVRCCESDKAACGDVAEFLAARVAPAPPPAGDSTRAHLPCEREYAPVYADLLCGPRITERT